MKKIVLLLTAIFVPVMIYHITVNAFGNQETLSELKIQETVIAQNESEKPAVLLDTDSYQMNVGDYYEFRAIFVEDVVEVVPLENEFFHCEKVRESENSAVYRIFGTSPGVTEAGLAVNGKKVSFPLVVQPADVFLDTIAPIAMESGGIYGFTVKNLSEDETVTADGMVISKVEKTDQPEHTNYYEVVALKKGNYRVSVSSASSTVAFPVMVVQSAMEEKAQSYSSSTGYLVLTDLTEQKVGIFQIENGKWIFTQSYLCSSGKSGTETPVGEFKVQNKGTSFYNRSLKEGAKWWVGFRGNYLYHSFPTDRDGMITDTRLGVPLSHGCVRLRTENAKWMYDHIPQGSKVVIYQ